MPVRSFYKYLSKFIHFFPNFFLPNLLSITLLKFLKCFHEKEISVLISNLKGELFVDVGANVGFYSIMMSKNFKRVVAFEPELSNMEELRQNTRIFAFKNILCIQKAVSDNNGIIQLNLSNHMGGHSILGSSKNSITVNACSLESFFEKDAYIDLIKVDVEGAEWMVLKGSEKIIGKIKSWIIELHDIERKKELEEWFISRGYSIYWLLFRKHEAFIYAWKNN